MGPQRVRVNWSKSVTNQREIGFLGYQISGDGVRIDPERLRPLLDAPEPRDEKSLRAFLGAVGYHARFLPRFSDEVEPLRAALRADAFEWTAALSSAVRRVKDAIRQAPALGMFDVSLPTVLSTDAITDTWWPDDDTIQIASLGVAAAAVTEAEFRAASDADETLRAVRGFVAGQWPRRKEIDPSLAGFYQSPAPGS
ncbi:putative mitochondrial protein [Amphibalanus amphitrite]|uniref:Putative mitochondrial protein n=1 Tax=Amphibalanus amphitrite TaxID=1232801 RepID=A0A6A4VY66_AMPAM|nr:putative mitochondrial protein [Amphibalanus amphitrite]